MDGDFDNKATREARRQPEFPAADDDVVERLGFDILKCCLVGRCVDAFLDCVVHWEENGSEIYDVVDISSSDQSNKGPAT